MNIIVIENAFFAGKKDTILARSSAIFNGPFKISGCWSSENQSW